MALNIKSNWTQTSKVNAFITKNSYVYNLLDKYRKYNLLNNIFKLDSHAQKNESEPLWYHTHNSTQNALCKSWRDGDLDRHTNALCSVIHYVKYGDKMKNVWRHSFHERGSSFIPSVMWSLSTTNNTIPEVTPVQCWVWPPATPFAQVESFYRAQGSLNNKYGNI